MFKLDLEFKIFYVVLDLWTLKYLKLRRSREVPFFSELSNFSSYTELF